MARGHQPRNPDAGIMSNGPFIRWLEYEQQRIIMMFHALSILTFVHDWNHLTKQASGIFRRVTCDRSQVTFSGTGPNRPTASSTTIPNTSTRGSSAIKRPSGQPCCRGNNDADSQKDSRNTVPASRQHKTAILTQRDDIMRGRPANGNGLNHGATWRLRHDRPVYKSLRLNLGAFGNAQ
ncbi:hypothetical protein BJX62DRAFT_22725 [Aspergillus germanicus]